MMTARSRSIAIQCILGIAIALLFYHALINVKTNMGRLGAQLGYQFLFEPAGFSIKEQWVGFQPSDSNAMVWLTGLVNMLVVGFTSMCTATFLGYSVAIVSLSTNTMVHLSARAYIEIFRNVPVLIQILFWYNIWIHGAPMLAESIQWQGILINNRGIFLPIFPVNMWVLVGLYAVVWAILVWHRPRSIRWLLFFAYVTLLWWVATAVLTYLLGDWRWPQQQGFGVVGAWQIYPEFIGLWLGLSLYTGAFCAEIIRAGLSAVPRGQHQAAEALGMTWYQTYRFVLIPQALPTIVPPLSSQYINAQKNTSLGVAVGYPEIFAVFVGTVLNQTGRTLEIILITMITYLVLSKCIQILMQIYNQRFSVWTHTQQG